MNPTHLPLSCDPRFVALSADPAVPLTPEQDRALWAGDFAASFRAVIQPTAHPLQSRFAGRDMGHETVGM